MMGLEQRVLPFVGVCRPFGTLGWKELGNVLKAC